MMGKATQDLRNEHDAILHVLEILDKMLSAQPKDETSRKQHFSELIRFLKIFADQCHHGKEENFLFEAMVSRGVPKEGSPVGAMLQEHVQGRAYIAMMDQAQQADQTEEFKAAAEKYRDLLRQHIEKENRVLFVMADQLLDDAAQDILFEKFEAHEENVIGHGVHEELHHMIHRWAEVYGV